MYVACWPRGPADFLSALSRRTPRPVFSCPASAITGPGFVDIESWARADTRGRCEAYLHLKAAGYPAQLLAKFPKSGLVVSHRDFLPIHLRPRAGTFLVCIKPDRKPHTWAHFYIVQNKADKIVARMPGRVRDVPFWPQPGLLPRSESRGTRCERATYFGHLVNLAPELNAPEWTSDMQAVGFTWHVPGLPEWHDYRETDIAVSVRQFGQAAAPDNPVLNPNSKPPSKLVNSWLAGVPAIVGRESSFAAVWFRAISTSSKWSRWTD